MKGGLLFVFVYIIKYGGMLLRYYNIQQVSDFFPELKFQSGIFSKRFISIIVIIPKKKIFIHNSHKNY